MGLAFILDNILVFLYRVIAKRIREHRCRDWVVVEGTIEAKAVERGSYPYASLNYTYAVAGERHDGTWTKPFWASDDAYAFIRRISQPCPVMVRYEPNNPALSCIRERDQFTATRNKSFTSLRAT